MDTEPSDTSQPDRSPRGKQLCAVPSPRGSLPIKELGERAPRSPKLSRDANVDACVSPRDAGESARGAL